MALFNNRGEGGTQPRGGGVGSDPDSAFGHGRLHEPG